MVICRASSQLQPKQKSIANIYRGELTDFINIKGGLGVFVDQNLVRNIVQERFGKSSGDTLAKQISDKMGEVLRTCDRFNCNGGDIGKLDDWGIPQSHNAEKLAVAGKQQWVNDATQTIDRNKYVNEDGTLYSDNQIKELLEYSFDSIVSDGANKTEVGKSSHQGTSKVTTSIVKAVFCISKMQMRGWNIKAEIWRCSIC